MDNCASLSPLIPEAAKYIQQKEMQEWGRFILSQHVERSSQLARTPTSVCEGHKAPSLPQLQNRWRLPALPSRKLRLWLQ